MDIQAASSNTIKIPADLLKPKATAPTATVGIQGNTGSSPTPNSEKVGITKNYKPVVQPKPRPEPVRLNVDLMKHTMMNKNDIASLLAPMSPFPEATKGQLLDIHV